MTRPGVEPATSRSWGVPSNHCATTPVHFDSHWYWYSWYLVLLPQKANMFVLTKPPQPRHMCRLCPPFSRTGFLRRCSSPCSLHVSYAQPHSANGRPIPALPSPGSRPIPSVACPRAGLAWHCGPRDRPPRQLRHWIKQKREPVL